LFSANADVDIYRPPKSNRAFRKYVKFTLRIWAPKLRTEINKST
jgi:hypothetical protein